MPLTRAAHVLPTCHLPLLSPRSICPSFPNFERVRTSVVQVSPNVVPLGQRFSPSSAHARRNHGPEAARDLANTSPMPPKIDRAWRNIGQSELNFAQFGPNFGNIGHQPNSKLALWANIGRIRLMSSKFVPKLWPKSAHIGQSSGGIPPTLANFDPCVSPNSADFGGCRAKPSKPCAADLASSAESRPNLGELLTKFGRTSFGRPAGGTGSDRLKHRTDYPSTRNKRQ